MRFGAHLPLIDLGGGPPSLAGLRDYARTAATLDYDYLCANDHLLFTRPWLDGPTALAAVVERSGSMELATTVSLVSLRGPVQLAKALAALDILSDGRVVAGVGPGSSERDYDAARVPYGGRWRRFDEATSQLRSLLRPDSSLAPSPRRESGIPIWLGSWGSAAGLRRVARLGDGWFASAYNTTPEGFGAARESLAEELRTRGKDPDGFPNALVTMWTWITEDEAEAERVLRDVLSPILRRDPDELRGRLCIGPAGACAELLSRYAEAGCERVHLWPLGDEPRQVELAAGLTGK